MACDPMTRRRLALVLSLSLLGLSALHAATPQMGISEIRPGMVGIGRTVFDGTHVEEFKAHVLGVIENVIGTQRNLILARLEGGPLANTGVIAGMSGSPVYIDGPDLAWLQRLHQRGGSTTPDLQLGQSLDGAARHPGGTRYCDAVFQFSFLSDRAPIAATVSALRRPDQSRQRSARQQLV